MKYHRPELMLLWPKKGTDVCDNNKLTIIYPQRTGLLFYKTLVYKQNIKTLILLLCYIADYNNVSINQDHVRQIIIKLNIEELAGFLSGSYLLHLDVLTDSSDYLLPVERLIHLVSVIQMVPWMVPVILRDAATVK